MYTFRPEISGSGSIRGNMVMVPKRQNPCYLSQFSVQNTAICGKQ